MLGDLHACLEGFGALGHRVSRIQGWAEGSAVSPRTGQRLVYRVQGSGFRVDSSRWRVQP